MLGQVGTRAHLLRIGKNEMKIWIYEDSHIIILKDQNMPFSWWLIGVTLVVGFGFLPQILGPWQGPMNALCCSVNVDGVVILLGGGGDTSTLHVVTKLV